MNRLISSSPSSSTISQVPPTPTPESSKNRFRAGLDWFQSQLNADGILNLGLGHSRRNNKHKSRRGRPSEESSADRVTHRIRFDAEKNETRATISLHEYTDDEFEGSFFNRDDLTRIFERTNRIVLQMESGEVDARVCTRGLDKLFGERQEACRTLRSKAVNAVMDLQEDQWESGQDDFDLLARVSSDITKEAAARALHEARQDVQAARYYLQDVDTSPWSSLTSTTRSSTTPSRSKSILKTRHSTSELLSTAFLFPENKPDVSDRGTRTGVRSTHERRTAPSRAKSMPVSDGKRSRSTPPVQRPTRPNRPQTRAAPVPLTPATTTSKPSLNVRVGMDSSMPTMTPMQRAKARVAHSSTPDTSSSEHRRNKIAAALTSSTDILELQSTDIRRNRAGVNRQLPRRCKSSLPTSTTQSSHHQRRVNDSLSSESTHSVSSFANDDHDDLLSAQVEPPRGAIPLRKSSIDANNTKNRDGVISSQHPKEVSYSSEHQDSSSGPSSIRQLPTRGKYKATLSNEDITMSGHNSSRHRRPPPQQGAHGDSSHHRRTTIQNHSEISGGMDNVRKTRSRTPPQRSRSSAAGKSSNDSSSSSSYHRQKSPQAPERGDLPKRRLRPPQRSQSELVNGANSAPKEFTSTGSSPKTGRPARRNRSGQEPSQRTHTPPNATAAGCRQKSGVGASQRSTSAAAISTTTLATGSGPAPPPCTSPTKMRPNPNEKCRQAPNRTKSLPATTPWAQRQSKATLA